jgi:dienelactone hydrolase
VDFKCSGFRQTADLFAEAGYMVLVPDYYRQAFISFLCGRISACISFSCLPETTSVDSDRHHIGSYLKPNRQKL